MKFATLFSIALATQAYDYATVDPATKCMAVKTITGVPTSTRGLGPAIQESFKNFRSSPTKPTYKVTTTTKFLGVKANIDDLEINVTINPGAGFQDAVEANQLRAIALLNVVGTLNLNYPLNQKPLWRAKININSSSPGDLTPSGTYSRGSTFITKAADAILGKAPTCRGPILK